LNVLATLAQIPPLLGLLGTVLGFLQIFNALQMAGSHAHMEDLAGGVWKALIAMAAGHRGRDSVLRRLQLPCGPRELDRLDMERGRLRNREHRDGAAKQ